MKILHINFSNRLGGGAAIAANRLNEAMNLAGYDSSLIVANLDLPANSHVYAISPNSIKSKLKKAYNFYIHKYLIKYYKPQGLFSISFWGMNLNNHPKVKEADIIIIHWVNSVVSINGIENLLKTGKTVFWFMHDMFPLTGGCHYAFECNKYQDQCCKCPLITHQGIIDIATLQFNIKLKKWEKYNNFRVITPSKWLGECAQKSKIFTNHPIYICRNLLNTNIFKPLDKHTAKEYIGTSKSKITILFGANDIYSPYKGWSYLKEAINRLDPHKYECLVFGQYNDEIKKEISINIKFAGYLKDEYSLCLVYNASDVFVIPSLADNYPNIIAESMSCGIPCVGFNIGGIPDLIKHKETGYLSKYKNIEDLVKGIEYVADNITKLSINSRKYIVNECSYSNCSSVYNEIFK